MARLKLLIQYDGASFCGWQRQAEAPGRRRSVQAVIEDGIARLLNLNPEEERIRLTAAGRTDTGVHARAMPAHFDCPQPIPAARLPLALNKFLPAEVSVFSAQEVAADFDARRDARLRWYRYQVRLSSAREPLGPRAWQVWKPIDLERILEALPLLEGKHDFAGFRSSDCQASRTILTMRQVRLAARSDLLAFDFKCRSFLHHQVRFMVGSLMALGTGQLTPEGLLRIRDAFDRPQLAACAPPHGLCLMGVGYAPEECDSLINENPPPPSF